MVAPVRSPPHTPRAAPHIPRSTVPSVPAVVVRPVLSALVVVMVVPTLVQLVTTLRRSVVQSVPVVVRLPVAIRPLPSLQASRPERVLCMLQKELA